MFYELTNIVKNYDNILLFSHDFDLAGKDFHIVLVHTLGIRVFIGTKPAYQMNRSSLAYQAQIRHILAAPGNDIVPGCFRCRHIILPLVGNIGCKGKVDYLLAADFIHPYASYVPFQFDSVDVVHKISLVKITLPHILCALCRLTEGKVI